jgi:hypothetical protein
MGSGITKPKQYNEKLDLKSTLSTTNHLNIRHHFNVLSNSSCKEKKSVELFLVQTMNLAKQTEVVTNILLNPLSRHYFIDYLKHEFEDDKIVISSWQVLFTTSMIIIVMISRHKDIAIEIDKNQKVHSKYGYSGKSIKRWDSFSYYYLLILCIS